MSEKEALVIALLKFQHWCETGGPDLVNQLAAAEAEVKRLRDAVQAIKDDCVCEDVHSRPHELTAIKCGVLSKAFALLAQPSDIVDQPGRVEWNTESSNAASSSD